MLTKGHQIPGTFSVVCDVSRSYSHDLRDISNGGSDDRRWGAAAYAAFEPTGAIPRAAHVKTIRVNEPVSVQVTTCRLKITSTGQVARDLSTTIPILDKHMNLS